MSITNHITQYIHSLKRNGANLIKTARVCSPSRTLNPQPPPHTRFLCGTDFHSAALKSYIRTSFNLPSSNLPLPCPAIERWYRYSISFDWLSDYCRNDAYGGWIAIASIYSLIIITQAVAKVIQVHTQTQFNITYFSILKSGQFNFALIFSLDCRQTANILHFIHIQSTSIFNWQTIIHF